MNTQIAADSVLEPPFVVPPFSPPPPSSITYVWWSWHPCYPYWSQSCWKAATIEEAQYHLTDPRTSLTVYHNKLIRHDGRTLTEVQDVPCAEMEVWHRIKKQMAEHQKETDQKAIPDSLPLVGHFKLAPSHPAHQEKTP